MNLERNFEQSKKREYNPLYLICFHGSYGLPILGTIASYFLYPGMNVNNNEFSLTPMGELSPTMLAGYIGSFLSSLIWLSISPWKKKSQNENYCIPPEIK